jgi:hypothetical protein
VKKERHFTSRIVYVTGNERREVCQEENLLGIRINRTPFQPERQGFLSQTVLSEPAMGLVGKQFFTNDGGAKGSNFELSAIIPLS